MNTNDDDASRPSENTNAVEQELRTVIATQEAKLLELVELVARVRHEINNPLTGVLGQAQLLQREQLPETARKRVETIEQLAIRIRDTVAALREVQRPNTHVSYDDPEVRTPEKKRE